MSAPRSEPLRTTAIRRDTVGVGPVSAPATLPDLADEIRALQAIRSAAERLVSSWDTGTRREQIDAEQELRRMVRG